MAWDKITVAMLAMAQKGDVALWVDVDGLLQMSCGNLSAEQQADGTFVLTESIVEEGDLTVRIVVHVKGPTAAIFFLSGARSIG